MAREMNHAEAKRLENAENQSVAALAKKKEKLKSQIKYQRDQDRKKVRGKFIFHEVPGGTMEFSFRKYKEDQIENYKLTDGEVYEIPLGVAKHLNQNLSYPVHQFYSSENGNHQMKIGQQVRRASFARLDFMADDDFDDIPSNLVTVEHVPNQVTI